MTTRITLEGASIDECAEQARQFADTVLGVVRNQPAPKPAAPKPAATPAADTSEDGSGVIADAGEPEAQKPAAAKPKKNPSSDDVIAAMREHSKAVSKESAVATINAMGYARGSEVPADKRQSVIDALAKNKKAA